MNPELDSLKHWKIVPERDAVRQRALEESLRVLRSARAESQPKRRFSLWLAMAGGAVAALLLATLILLRPTSGDSLDSSTLAEFQSLFGPTLNALIKRDGKIEVLTVGTPPLDRGQPILIKAQTASGPMEIVGFSGSRFELEIEGRTIEIEPLVNADGSILLCGEHFIWGPHLKKSSLPSELQNVRAEQMTPAT